MREQREPTTRTMKAAEARAQWSQLINQVNKREARIVVEKSGMPVAAVVSIDDLKRLQGLEASREEDFQALAETREAFRDIPDDELEREVDRAYREGRERHRRSQASKRSAPTA